jgi:hypothetical protein
LWQALIAVTHPSLRTDTADWLTCYSTGHGETSDWPSEVAESHIFLPFFIPSSLLFGLLVSCLISLFTFLSFLSYSFTSKQFLCPYSFITLYASYPRLLSFAYILFVFYICVCVCVCVFVSISVPLPQ